MKKRLSSILLCLPLSISICGCSIMPDKASTSISSQPTVVPTAEPIDYSKYVGVWQDEADDMGRHNIGLTIYQINGSTMDFELYRLRGKNITYTVNTITFTDEYTVSATGECGFLPENPELTPVSYELRLGEDTISLILSTEYPEYSSTNITLYKDQSAPAVTPRPV